MKQEKKSEFGKGFIYNLILFAKHWAQARPDIESLEKAFEKTYSKKDSQREALSMWFNAASDHFIEFKIPKQYKKKKIGKLAKSIQEKSLYWGHGFKEKPTKKDFAKIFNEIEALTILIDKELKIEDIKAEYN